MQNLDLSGRLALVVKHDALGPHTLDKLCRYEARLERSFYKVSMNFSVSTPSAPLKTKWQRRLKSRDWLRFVASSPTRILTPPLRPQTAPY